MNRRNRIKRARRKDALNLAIGFTGFAFILYLLFAQVPIFFAHLDCNTARNGLDFIERCEAESDCTLNARDLQLKRVYTRLEIKSCPRED